MWCHDIENNNTQLSGIQHTGTQHNRIETETSGRTVKKTFSSMMLLGVRVKQRIYFPLISALLPTYPDLT